MHTDDIFKKAVSFKTALAVNVIPHGVRTAVVFLCLAAAVFSLSVLVLGAPVAIESAALEKVRMMLMSVLDYQPFFTALACVAAGLGMLGIGINSFHTYHYLRGVRRVFEKKETDITYEVAEVFSSPLPTLNALFQHKESAFLLNRLRLDKDYLSITFGDLPLPTEVISPLFESHLTLGSLWQAAYETHKELAGYLLSQSVKKQTLYRTAAWMDRLLEDRKKERAWWWRENLSKVRGLAKILSYGMTGYMSHYAKEMIHDPKLSDLGDVILHQEECDQLEEILTKKQGSNAVIVGPDGSGRYTVTLALARAIEQGYVYSEIEHKRMFLIHASSFELINEKVALENSIITIFNEAVVAGNIIFVIDDIVKLTELCKQFGVDFFSLIDSYIAHSATSLVVLTDETTYSQDEYRHVFESRFEVVKMRDLNSDLLLPYLEDKAIAVERVTGKYFTYTALEMIAQSLSVFFVEDAPLAKANALLEAIANTTSSTTILGDDDVQTYLQTTTGVMQGKVGEEEKENLLHLEDILSQNVIGQKEAISAVAKTMRRIRSGVADGGKPMGTFLFLGPTGSGKTETAKTLAKVFFGREEYMSRIDMGEYTLPESVERVLGNKEHEGELARLVHLRPHGVLLLDEFEKSSKDIQDLFLRILDEGVFTDGQGHIVSLRTQIIIATSNAGTELIRESHLSSKYDEATFSAVKREVIDTILKQGIFKPELVNRFDATVMFLPLSHETVKGVTKKILDELGARVQERGYSVVWSDDLVEYVAEHSQTDEFGGRAIQRVIQDTVEDILSKRIIQGDLKTGDTITLSRGDMSLA